MSNFLAPGTLRVQRRYCLKSRDRLPKGRHLTQSTLPSSRADASVRANDVMARRSDRDSCATEAARHIISRLRKPLQLQVPHPIFTRIEVT
jgi:hypothetical protein